jgi:hypothetical protein
VGFEDTATAPDWPIQRDPQVCEYRVRITRRHASEYDAGWRTRVTCYLEFTVTHCRSPVPEWLSGPIAATKCAAELTLLAAAVLVAMVDVKTDVAPVRRTAWLRGDSVAVTDRGNSSQ